MNYYLVSLEVIDVGEHRPILVKGHAQLSECISTLNNDKYKVRDIHYLENVVEFNEFLEELKPDDLNLG